MSGARSRVIFQISQAAVLGECEDADICTMVRGVGEVDWAPFVDYYLATGMKLAEIDEYIIEIVRFLMLKAKANDFNATKLSGSAAVDEVWHTLLLFPQIYYQLCQGLCGRLINHDPNRSRDAISARICRVNKTTLLYQAVFKNTSGTQRLWVPPCNLGADAGEKTDDEDKGFSWDCQLVAQLAPKTVKGSNIIFDAKSPWSKLAPEIPEDNFEGLSPVTMKILSSKLKKETRVEKASGLHIAGLKLTYADNTTDEKAEDGV